MTEEEGWPHDPLLRVLRTFSVVAFIILLFIVLVFRDAHDVTTVGFLIGAILIQLSYDVLISLPGAVSKRLGNDQKDKPDDHH